VAAAPGPAGVRAGSAVEAERRAVEAGGRAAVEAGVVGPLRPRRLRDGAARHRRVPRHVRRGGRRARAHALLLLLLLRLPDITLLTDEEHMQLSLIYALIILGGLSRSFHDKDCINFNIS
jgi:hypothetical protein